MTTIQDVDEFLGEQHISDNIPEMEISLEKANGLYYYIGSCVNKAEFDYALKRAHALGLLKAMPEETETTRKAKLDLETSEQRRTLMDLKNMSRGLRAIQMTLLQAIKTRREERQ